MPIPFNNMASSSQVLDNSQIDSLLEIDKDQSELQDFSKMEISQTQQSRNKKNLKSATEMHKAPYNENLVNENMSSERLLTNSNDHVLIQGEVVNNK